MVSYRSILVTLVCLFGGCRNMSPEDYHYLVIERIQQRDNKCIYFSKEGWKFRAYCGKFNIGDTVWVNYLKNEKN